MSDIFSFQNRGSARARAFPGSLNRRHSLRLSLGAGLLLTHAHRALFAAHVPAKTHWQQRVMLAFGTQLWLRAAHIDVQQLTRALDSAVSSIQRVERQMSLFIPDSSIHQLNRNGSLANPDRELLAALELSEVVARRSSGAFDITIQPIWRAWADAQARGQIVSPDTLARAREKTGWQHLKFSAARIAFGRPGMTLTLNGIVQGFAADHAREVLQAHGIEHALIDTGEWSAFGSSPDGRDWTLGIQHPRFPERTIAIVRADGRSLASSSDTSYVFTPDRRHHHILDPATGYSPVGIASVTVAAHTCALADALTKVMFMGSTHDAVRLANDWGVDVLAIAKDGSWQASGGMPIA